MRNIPIQVINVSYTPFVGRSLFWVFVYGSIFLYIYALVAFAHLRIVFNPDEGMYCNTFYQCMVTSIRRGLIDGMFNVCHVFVVRSSCPRCVFVFYYVSYILLYLPLLPFPVYFEHIYNILFLFNLTDSYGFLSVVHKNSSVLKYFF